MEEDTSFNKDDSYYPSNYEDDVEYILGVEDLLFGSSIDHQSTSYTTTKDVYFHLSDFESSFDSDEDMEHMHGGDGGWESSSLTSDLAHSIDESSKPLFDHVPIESCTKSIQFTLASRDLMIHCLRSQRFPTFLEIREADINFGPLPQSHGRVIDMNDPYHTQARWMKLQGSLKLIESIDGVGLSIANDTKEREICHYGMWSSIVSSSHVTSSGKHLPLGTTTSTIRKKWIQGLEAFLHHILKLSSILPSLSRTTTLG